MKLHECRKRDTISTTEKSRNRFYIMHGRGWDEITARPDGIHARFSRPNNCLRYISIIVQDIHDPHAANQREYPCDQVMDQRFAFDIS
jgi:hypothetical protein